MFFSSDNAGPAHPKVIEAVIQANTGYAPGYGGDAITEAARQQVRDVFEAPDAAVYFVINGTSANALLLATMSQPWDTIFCADVAHIQEDECNAPEFYSQAKLTLVPTVDGKMSPDALRAKIESEQNRGVHGPQRGPLSITQVTEKGTIYSLDEIRALTDVAREFGMKTHMDGARFANAMVALDCTAAEMSWKAGIDTISFGGTKNGALGVEACVIFDPDLAWEFELRRKRGGHLLSKHRFLSAQMQGYLTDDLWLETARAANARCAQLADGLRGHNRLTFQFDPQANIIFFEMPRSEHKRMLDGGAFYYLTNGEPDSGDPDEMLTGRLVTDWSVTEDAVQQFIDLLHG
ncbi:low specificity L-threonine aldolase [Loktanella sp. D2R18]|uniref:threonine aldolase family protein n=1 Tax=Rhodobacterales TaxID=204455 RepID=UPI000DE80335|nr:MULTISPECIES: low specificity L-threonine aldolase [Rhodobacterales]MDO6591274.1 low specificity L-threonine aldolase [Yoonia sp. 1_MG-2023]RBW46228.1 low specificity L-threonine aldolase [Loktanella sp. D2R18]